MRIPPTGNCPSICGIAIHEYKYCYEIKQMLDGEMNLFVALKLSRKLFDDYANRQSLTPIPQCDSLSPDGA